MAGAEGVRRGSPFSHALGLAGWSWRYDGSLECCWAELWWQDDDPEPSVRISAEHLVPTVAGLARAVSFRVGVPDVEAYLALAG